VLVHVIPQLLKFDDLVKLPSEQLIPTLLDGADLRPSLAGATSGSNAGSEGSGSIGLLATDKDACAPNSTLHTIKGLLLPDGYDLPRSAQPRDLSEQQTVSSRAVGNEGGSSDGGSSLTNGAIAGIAAAGVAAILLLLVIGVIVVASKRRKDKMAEEEFKAMAANNVKTGYPPNHPMYAGGSEFSSMPSGAAPQHGVITSGFESQWGPAPPASVMSAAPHGSFVSAGSGHPPPYPGVHPGAPGALPYSTPQQGFAHGSAMGYGSVNNTHSSVGSDPGRRGLGVHSVGTDTYHERNIMRDSPGGTYNSGVGAGSAMGALQAFLC
jgi:hypothetical protein